MASVTRSSRRAEGQSPTMRSRPANFDHAGSGGGGGGGGSGSVGAGGGEVGQGGGAGGGGGRTKRSIDVPTDFEPIKSKKARIAVEILSPQQQTVPRRSKNASEPSKKGRGGGPTATVKPNTPNALPNAGNAFTAVAPAAAPRSKGGAATTAPSAANTTNIPSNNNTTSTSNTLTSNKKHGNSEVSAERNIIDANSTDSSYTKHQAKVINGIKHELDRLQPEGTAGKEPEPGRKLRSQEATRFKSELSAYFPDYDEVIGNEPKEEHLLNVDTPILIQDSSLGAEQAGFRTHSTTRLNSFIANPTVRGYGDSLYNRVVDAQRIDFSFLQTQFKNKTPEDPLPDSFFEPVHKRAERLERSIRNTEKGRAQHEKDQVIRLFEGLQGHDWLKVLGVTGVTETRKKTFEPARQHYIRGCQAIIDKFKNWSLEEKRRKLEKEQARAGPEEDEEVDGEGETDEEFEPYEEQVSQESKDGTSEGADGSSIAGTSDASSPAKQLQEEAMARSKLSSKTTRATARPESLRPPAPPSPPKEFKTFFSKRYERDSAVNRTRRAGRKVLAWGLPIPDFAESDFDLPEMYRGEETLRLRARKKRRDKRSSRG